MFFFLSFVSSVVFRFAGTLLCDGEDDDDADDDEEDVENDGEHEDDDVDEEPDDEDDDDDEPSFVPTFSRFHRSKLSLLSSARRINASFSVGPRAIQSLFKRSSR